MKFLRRFKWFRAIQDYDNLMLAGVIAQNSQNTLKLPKDADARDLFVRCQVLSEENKTLRKNLEFYEKKYAIKL